MIPTGIYFTLRSQDWIEVNWPKGYRNMGKKEKNFKKPDWEEVKEQRPKQRNDRRGVKTQLEKKPTHQHKAAERPHVMEQVNNMFPCV